MPRIQVLPDLLVNKIAAGEVIERPASVLKELVENSIDAGATRIEITIEQGGSKLIRITDDGQGMDPQDLAMCIRPHATSKIRNEQDLFAIQTMGFRGEALPSIGAVSQLRIVSRQPDAEAAHEICTAGDHMEPLRISAGPPGTTVEVRQLFFNVPARQKFLRTPQTEVGHITEQLARIALVYPRIEFRLTHNGRLVHHLRPAEAMRSRIADFYGRELADCLLEINRNERGLRIAGYVAPPTQSRSASKWQYLFLNGRFIRDRFVTAAVREAFRGLMDPSRHPVIFMALEIDPANVDVNVHPTKSEVRWRDSSMLYSQILSAIRDRFLNTDLTPDLSTSHATSDAKASGTMNMSVSAEASGTLDAHANTSPNSERYNPTYPQASRAVPTPVDYQPRLAPSPTNNDAEAQQRRQQIRQSMADFFKRAKPIVANEYQSTPQRVNILASPANPNVHEHESQQESIQGFQSHEAAQETQDLDTTEPNAVIQIHRCYLVAETTDGMVIIDQHALHERILFEQLSEQVSRGPLESQHLLLPEIIDVSPDQIAVIESHADTLQRLGLSLSAYGPGTIAVHAAPSLLRPERTREFIRDLLDRLADRQAPASIEMIANDLLAMMACKAAVKAGDPLSQQEIAALMAKRPTVERSTNCPHGRPTSLRLTIADLEKQFKRTGF